MKFIQYVVGLIVASVIVGLIFSSYRQSSQKSSDILDDNNRTHQAMIERSYKKYLGPEVNGATVLNACRALKDELEVTVVIGSKTIKYNSTSGAITNKPSEPNYISPNLSFTGTLVYNSSDVLTGISFVKN